MAALRVCALCGLFLAAASAAPPLALSINTQSSAAFGFDVLVDGRIWASSAGLGVRHNGAWLSPAAPFASLRLGPTSTARGQVAKHECDLM
jgi:hypothetical protein